MFVSQLPPARRDSRPLEIPRTVSAGVHASRPRSRPAVLAAAFSLAALLGLLAAPANALLAVVPPPITPPPATAAEPPVYRQFEGPLSALEQALFRDAADGRWDEHTLLRAAIVASGAQDPRALSRYESKLHALVDRLRAQGAMALAPEPRARMIFQSLHADVLTAGYRLDATDLRRTLDEGCFNCVSASVLFICLAERLELRAQGMELPGHAMARVVLDDGQLDVETTCRRWFELADDPSKLAEVVEKTTGYRPSGFDRDDPRREVSDVELVATIFYNRGVDLLAAERFPEALAANAKALRLDPRSETAWGNLLATLNNWAIACGAEAKYEQALGLLRQGLEMQPDYETFMLNFVHVHHQWTEQLCREGRFERAMQLLSEAVAEYPEQPWFDRALADVYHRWVREEIDRHGGRAAADVERRLQRALPKPPAARRDATDGRPRAR